MADSEHWKCLRCGYDLYGLTGDPLRCPECGFANALEELEIASKVPSSRALPVAMMAILFSTVATIYPTLTTNRDSISCLTAVAPFVSFVLAYIEPRGAWRWATMLLTGHVVAFFCGARFFGSIMPPLADVLLGAGLWLMFVLVPGEIASQLRKSEWRRAALAERQRRAPSDHASS